MQRVDEAADCTKFKNSASCRDRASPPAKRSPCSPTTRTCTSRGTRSTRTSPPSTPSSRNRDRCRPSIETESAKPDVLKDLKILYVGGKVDPESRTFQFYVPLANQQLRDVTPARRSPLHRLAIQAGPARAAAVAGRAMDRPHRAARRGRRAGRRRDVRLHAERRPLRSRAGARRVSRSVPVVIANDGSIFPGDAVVLAGAQQMQLALKNKSGGGHRSARRTQPLTRTALTAPSSRTLHAQRHHSLLAPLPPADDRARAGRHRATAATTLYATCRSTSFPTSIARASRS